MTRQPIAFDSEQGAEAAALFSDLSPELVGLLRGAAGCSPYLKGLMEREADWLRAALSGDPEPAFEALLSHDATSSDALGIQLRQGKRRMALLTGLADLAGVWSLEEVTGALTRYADFATQSALIHEVGREISRGKIDGLIEDDIPNAGGAVALAMGKMGAFELNYSSDIDLIMLFDDSRFDDRDVAEARPGFIRAVRRMSSLLSEMTGEGYVFRTDLRLRPDPSVTPVIIAMAGAEAYYESLGRTWERAAHIKARPCAGDLAAGAAYLERLRPFIWRKHLDFAAIQDAHDMRLRIREHKGLHGPITLPGHDMKLGRGGIREIEFFTQTRQLIAGGRDPDLRLRGTVEGLAALVEKGWVPEETARILTKHYRFHREVEHRVQMVRDAQTHLLPKSDEGFTRLAMMMGEGDVSALQTRLVSALSEVHELTEGFFAPGDAAPAAPELELSEEDIEIVRRWRSYPACRSTRATEIFERLKPDILSRLQKAARPREALVQFDAFLSGLPAGVQLFSLFEANPQLVDLIVDIVSTSPALAVFLGRNAQVLDAVIGGGFFAPWPGRAALVSELEDLLTTLDDDYEAQLDAARRWMKEWHFRIGVHHLRGLIDSPEASGEYADLADAVITALWPIVGTVFAKKHGAAPGRGAVVIGMGSLGGRMLSSTSDLDLIVIYDPAGEEMSDGRRPLATRAYYARLTQAMVTALSAPMSEGKLYEVDMRLRPSGRQGPVATALEAYRTYQSEEAWTWEHLALTRARVVTGASDVAADVEAIRADVLSRPRDAQATIADLVDMRARIAEAKGAGAGALDAKIGPGRLQDIELVAQAAVLFGAETPRATADQIAMGQAIGWFSADAAQAMTAAHSLFWHLQVAARLISDGALNLDAVGVGGRRFLLRETGMDSAEALSDAVAIQAAMAARAIDEALIHPPGGQ